MKNFNCMMVAVRTMFVIAMLSMVSISIAEAADTEDAEAVIRHAETYWKGEGVPKDYAKAFELLNPLAIQGNAKAQNRLGTLYIGGPGITQDYAKAVEWYQKSAAQGFGGAQNNLGNMYLNGQGITQDYAKAFEWYQKSAAQGFAMAQNGLGFMYYNGKGVTQDYAKAFELYQKSAAQGFANTQYFLGVMYYNGKGVTQDYAKAFEWYQKSAAQGLAMAQASLGVMYYQGIGVTKDYAKAFEWFQKSAAQGYRDAQFLVGAMYYKGQGVTQSYARAIEWYQKSAAQGNADAQFNLAHMPAGINAVTEQRILLAAIGGMRGHYTSNNCHPLSQSINRSEGEAIKECIKQDFAKMVAMDEAGAINSVMSVTNQAGLTSYLMPNEYDSSKLEVDYSWTEKCKEMMTLLVISSIAQNPSAYHQIQSWSHYDFHDPNKEQTFRNSLNWVEEILNPVRSERQKQANRINEEIQAAFLAWDGQQRKLDEEEQRQIAEQNAQQARQQEQAKIKDTLKNQVQHF